MLETLIGFISGIVSGTGMGGGTILILCLSIFLGINQKTAQATNLIFFIGTIIGALIAQKINVTVLKKMFGIFLAIIAIHEIYLLIKEYIFYKNGKDKIKEWNDVSLV